MAGSRWAEARDALLEIAEYALKLNVHTVSLRFLNNRTHDRGLQVSNSESNNLLHRLTLTGRIRTQIEV